jgi:hypothetical protein
MNEPIGHADSLLEHFATSLGGGGRLDGYVRRRAARSAHCDAISRHLASVRSSIDDAIDSCDRRESLGGATGSVYYWQDVPHHLTEIDSLQRLSRHLDRVVERFRRALPANETRGSIDVAYDLGDALAACASAMVRRFEVPNLRHDLQAALESDLRKFERLMDEYALALSNDWS